MCSENMQQIYRKIRMSKCDFNKVALQVLLNIGTIWSFSSCLIFNQFWASTLKNWVVCKHVALNSYKNNK